MFRRFSPAEDVSTTTALKNSSVRGMKRGVCDQYPSLEPFIDDIVPKKDEVKESKGKDRVSFIVVAGEPLFFRVREGPYFPTLRLLHKCARGGVSLRARARAACAKPPPPTPQTPS